MATSDTLAEETFFFLILKIIINYYNNIIYNKIINIYYNKLIISSKNKMKINYDNINFVHFGTWPNSSVELVELNIGAAHSQRNILLSECEGYS